MPDTFLNCNLRNEVGSNASHKVRGRGHVPGVIYGQIISNYPLEFDKKELKRIIKEHGENAIVNVMVNDSSYPAMIKEIQRDTITGEIIHVDLQQINTFDKIHVSIPITLNGKEKVDSFGILQKQMEKVDVECYPDKVPKFISVDVSNLNIGESLRISDVEFGEELSVLNGAEEVIVSLSYAKQEIVDEEEDDVVTDMIIEKKEPELVSKHSYENSEK